MAQNKVSDVTKKNPEKADEKEDFIFEDIRFKETDNCKVRCGICEVECTRLIVHMNGNKYCTEYFSNMTEFKQKYSEFRDKKSRRKSADKKEAEDQKGSQEFIAKRKLVLDEKEYGKTAVPTQLDESSKAGHKIEKDCCFKFGGFDFPEVGGNKIRCGVCQVDCIRLVFHLNRNKECSEKFCMLEFRTEYSRYRHNQREKKNQSKKKS